MTPMVPDMTTALNAWLWVTANVALLWGMIANLFFATFYASQFPWRQFAAGRAVLYVSLALGAYTVNSFIGVFVDPQVVPWWIFPVNNVEAWRPVVRAVTNFAVAASMTNLCHVIWIRRFHPERSPDLGILKNIFTANEPRSQ